MRNKITLFVILGLTLITMNFSNSYGASTCSRDCFSPTLGLSNDGERLVNNGFTIKNHAFDVEQFEQTIPTQNYKVGDTINIKLVVYENNGVDSLSHISLIIGDFPDRYHEIHRASIFWDQKFDGTVTVGTLDFDNILKDVIVKAQKIDSFNTELDISFSIIKPLDVSSIRVDMWDQIRSSRTNYFTNAISVDPRNS